MLEAIELDNTFDAVQTSNDSYDRRFTERSSGEVKIHHPARPGAIDNSHLILPQTNKVTSYPHLPYPSYPPRPYPY